MDVQGKLVLLAGLEPAVAEELMTYLAERGMEVTQTAEIESNSKADLVFCGIHHPGLVQLLEAMDQPVVVVSRVPEVDDWLDAMDAGAADYCAAPFERDQLDWILESNLKGKGCAAIA